MHVPQTAYFSNTKLAFIVSLVCFSFRTHFSAISNKSSAKSNFYHPFFLKLIISNFKFPCILIGTYTLGLLGLKLGHIARFLSFDSFQYWATL
jgi:hypothetical protein